MDYLQLFTKKVEKKTKTNIKNIKAYRYRNILNTDI